MILNTLARYIGVRTPPPPSMVIHVLAPLLFFVMEVNKKSFFSSTMTPPPARVTLLLYLRASTHAMCISSLGWADGGGGGGVKISLLASGFGGGRGFKNHFCGVVSTHTFHYMLVLIHALRHESL